MSSEAIEFNYKDGFFKENRTCREKIFVLWTKIFFTEISHLFT